MATQSNPRPNDIPQRPRLDMLALGGLVSDCVTPGALAAQDWLTNTREWAAWAIGYCKRLDAVYVEHQAVAHNRRVESGDLGGYATNTLGVHYAATVDNCKVCAYLLEQYQANQL